jgi:hypothetical protein
MSRIRAAPRFDDKRPALARLESLVTEPALARSQRILIRIRKDLDKSPEPGPWILAAQSLEACGLISADVVIYFTEIFLECITLHASKSDAELLGLYDEMHRVERAHGLLEDEVFRLKDAPAQWHALNEAWDRRADAISVATLRALGQDDLADLREKNPDEFELRSSAGYQVFWGEIDDDEDLE